MVKTLYFIEKFKNQEPMVHDKKILFSSESNQQMNSPSVLDAGDRGEAVRKLQSALILHGASIKADGVFGIETQAAVQDFQAQYHLKIDGVAGEKTQDKLSEVLLEKATIQKNKVPSSLVLEPSLYDKVEGFSSELRAIHDKLEGYLRPELEKANVKEHHADAMIATGVQESIAKNISANEMVYASIDKNKNLISIFSSTEFKFVCFDAISASRNDPEKILAEAQKELEQPKQQHHQERNGPTM